MNAQDADWMSPETIDDLNRWIDDVVLRRRSVVVVSDFDGTLAPIVEDFADARLLEGSAAVLQRLADIPGVNVAVVSGRGTRDLMSRFRGVDRVTLCPEYGSVIVDRAGQMTVLREEIDTEQVFELVRLAVDASEWGHGARIETKPGGVALHLRRVPPDLRAKIAARFRAAAIACGARMIEGRMVVEARFRHTSKAMAIEALLAPLGDGSSIVFGGDDETDEDAYQVVLSHPRGLAFHVGSQERPHARTPVNATVPGPHGWLHVLTTIAEALGRRRA